MLSSVIKRCPSCGRLVPIADMVGADEQSQRCSACESKAMVARSDRMHDDLWSKPGDVVLSPFAGIGSEGYVAVSKGRRFVGIELKPSYFQCAVKNLHRAEDESRQLTFDDFLSVG